MKHLALYIGLATALVVSCSTKEIDIQAPQQDDVVFYASFEQPGEEGTRVYANEDHFLRWNADDRVSIFNKLTYNQQYKFTGETGDNAGGFKKVDADEFVTGNAISHVVSIYPYQEATKITESESLTLTLPAEQHYAENTFGLGANTMVSVTSDNVLLYKNVGGYLVFKLYGESVSVSSITLKGNNGEKIAGKASVTMPLGGVPSVTMAEDATDEITLTCPEPVALGATAEESSQFWFVVPPVTFSKGFTITVNDSYGGTFKKSTSKSVAIERNILTRMSPIEVVVEPKRTVTITAVLGEETRTSNDGSLKWEAGDQINVLVTDGSIQKQVTFITAESGHEVQFTGEVEEGFYLMGVATYAMIFDIEKNAWIIPSSVTVDPDNPLSSVPLIGTDTSDNRYLFHASTGVFEFNVRNVPLNAAYAVLETIGEDAPSLWGELTSIPEDGIVTMNALIGGGKKLISVGAPAEPNTTLTYWFFVPIGNLPAEKAQFSLCDAYGNVVKSLLFPRDIEVKANTIRVFSIPFDPIPIPDAVDLGLSVKWASFNLGASSPEEYGDYYAWGETTMKSNYAWSTYKWCNGSVATLTKYCTDSYYGYNGFTDGKTVLDPEDDAAHVNLGGKWRMPTDDEWTELRMNCTWSWTRQNGVDGYLVSGPNGNSIFLPAAGCRDNTDLSVAGSNGDYWSSSLYTDNPYLAWDVYFYSGIVFGNRSRCSGLSVRPVYGEFITVDGISLNKSSMSLKEGETSQLSVTVRPSTATVKTVTWSSSNTSVASVDSNGMVTAVSAGTATITVWASDGVHSATCDVTVRESTVSVPEAIDLGLPSGLKWASWNLGASKPEEYGDYYAWGETESYYSSLDPLVWREGKEAGYEWASYKWCMGGYNTMTKYCNSSSYGSYGYNGFTDGKTVLDPEDDAAHANLGGKWRMPTDAEWSELRENCAWTWTTKNGIEGRLVTASNGNSIFLPAASGWEDTSLLGPLGIYWSSSLYTGYSWVAWYVYFNSDGVSSDYLDRCFGFSVRPVSE